MSRYVPHFIALAASSPYVQGEDTAFQSARLNTVFAFPLSGQAPFELGWEDFGRYFSKMERTGRSAPLPPSGREPRAPPAIHSGTSTKRTASSP